MSVTSQGWTSNEKEEEDDGGGFMTNVEERLLKEQQKEADKAAKEEADRRKAEEEARKAEQERIEREALAARAAAEKAAAEKAAAEKAAREQAAKVASDRAKGEKTTGVLEEDAPPSPSAEPSTRSVNPAAAAAAPASANNPEQLRARQDIARKLRSALGAEDGRDKDEMIAGLKADAKSAGVADTAFDSFMERELARPSLGTYERPTQEQIVARQDAANRIKAGIRSGDPNIISAAKEDAIIAGVPMGRAWEFERNQAQELARRGEIQPGTTFGKSGNLDAYYAAQTEKSRGIPLGYRSGKSVPIAPDWRIHTRLNRLVNRRTYEGDQDRSISPEAAAMRFAEATGRKLAFNRPLEYIQQQQDLRDLEQRAIRNNQPLGTNLYGFGSR
jgi:hypothetical protein